MSQIVIGTAATVIRAYTITAQQDAWSPISRTVNVTAPAITKRVTTTAAIATIVSPTAHILILEMGFAIAAVTLHHVNMTAATASKI